MASGAGTALRIAGSAVALVVIVWTTGIGYQVLEPFYFNMNPPVDALGWNDGGLVLKTVGLGLIGLVFTTLVWMIFEPIRDDTRQDIDRGPF